MHVNISLLSIDIDNYIFTMNMIQTEFRLCICSYLLCCYFKTHRVIVRWYGTPPYCDVFPIEINNKMKYKFINYLFLPEIVI